MYCTVLPDSEMRPPSVVHWGEAVPTLQAVTGLGTAQVPAVAAVQMVTSGVLAEVLSVCRQADVRQPQTMPFSVARP